MDNIFVKEEEVLQKALDLLNSGTFESESDAGHYRLLLNEYHSLISQMKRVVKISDLMESKLNVLSRKLDELSKVDFLTNLYNRRYFNEHYQREWNSAVRLQSPLSIILLDIDHFKLYNDTYGHLEGDKCLQSVSAVLPRVLKRPRDIAARYGGEEFIVLMPETDATGALHIAQAIQENIEALRIQHAHSTSTGFVTVSIGVASTIPKLGIPSSTLIHTADENLYKAKDDGRNCIRG